MTLKCLVKNLIYLFLDYNNDNQLTGGFTWNHSTMAEISISIENKYFGGEHKVITLKQQFLGIILRFLCI